MKLFQIIDYGGGNLGSVLRCLQRLSIPYTLCSGGEDGQPADNQPVLLPGVGSFGAVMAALHERGLVAPLRRLLSAGTPYLGICVGLQILFAGSSESPGVAGLGVLAGQVVRFPDDASGLKVPQIGWNRVAPGAADPGAPPGFAYFVNSYYAVPEDPGVVLYQARYGVPFCAAVRRGALMGSQFHPERSGPFGHDLVRRFFDAC